MVVIEDLRDEREESKDDTKRKLEKLSERITPIKRVRLGAIVCGSLFNSIFNTDL